MQAKIKIFQHFTKKATEIAFDGFGKAGKSKISQQAGLFNN